MSQLALIVAMTPQGVIGHKGALPWKLSADLRRFKQLTMHHPIIMGRRTFESIGRLLPGRTTIVVTSQPDFPLPEGALRASGLEGALQQVADNDVAFVIGGAQLYAAALPRAELLYVTWVDANLDGDTYFPTWDASQWQLVHEESFPADASNEYPQRFCKYLRIR